MTHYQTGLSISVSLSEKSITLVIKNFKMMKLLKWLKQIFEGLLHTNY